MLKFYHKLPTLISLVSLVSLISPILFILFILFYTLHSLLAMRIAIDARMYGPSQTTGIGQYIEQLTNHLFQIDNENQYILFMREPEYSNFTPPNNRVKKVLAPPYWYSYAEQIQLPLILAKEKFDLIHFPHFNSPILFNKPSVCTIHDLTPFYFDGHKMKSSFRKWAHRKVFTNTITKAKHILTVSNSTKNGLIEKFQVPENKISVTYLGVDEKFRVLEKNDIINAINEKYKISSPFIFYVGAWRNHKNLETLIGAFERLKEQYRLPHQLVLAGQEDPHYPNIRQRIEKSPFKSDIVTPGFIENSDLPSLYNSASAFVIPSFIEGFGLIAIEAQKCGCPVVASDTSSLPEVLNNSALFFDPHDEAMLTSQLFMILTNENQQKLMRERGFENVNRFSWNKCAEQTLAVYQAVIGNKNNI